MGVGVFKTIIDQILGSIIVMYTSKLSTRGIPLIRAVFPHTGHWNIPVLIAFI
jgi:hypothetical protein